MRSYCRVVRRCGRLFGGKLILGDVRFKLLQPELHRVERMRFALAALALFAGSDGGGEDWAIIASLIETCKLCEVERTPVSPTSSPKSSTVIPTAKINDLLPRAYPAASALQAGERHG